MRRFIRHPSELPIEYRLLDEEKIRSDRLKDVAIAGLCFHSEKALEIAQLIQVQFPVGDPPAEAVGRIVRCCKREQGFEIGVAFADSETAYLVRMVEQLCHIHAYQRYQEREKGRVLNETEAANEWIARFAARFPSANEDLAAA